MTDQDLTQLQSHTDAVNRVVDHLNRNLGDNYSPDILKKNNTDKALQERMYHRIAATEVRRQKNIEAIAQATYEACQGESAQQTGGDIDPDWLAKFVIFGQDVGNPDMQQVWGHVLARKSEVSGRISIQALTALANMVPADLDLWEKVGHIAFPTGYLIKLGGRQDFDDFGISEQDITRLQTLGLLQETEDLGVTFYAPTNGINFDFKGAALVVRHPTSQLFSLPAFRMTGLGIELLPLLADVSVNVAYLKALGDDLVSQGYDFRIRDAQGALMEPV